MFGQEGPERILELEAHSDRVDSIQWANQGLRFISGSKDGTAILWRYEQQEWKNIKLRMETGGMSASDQKLKVNMVQWTCDDRWLITAVSDYSLKVWDSTTGWFIRCLANCLGDCGDCSVGVFGHLGTLHKELRVSKKKQFRHEMIMQLNITRTNLLVLVKSMKHSDILVRVILNGPSVAAVEQKGISTNQISLHQSIVIIMPIAHRLLLILITI